MNTEHLTGYDLRACEDIDAAVFSGDMLQEIGRIKHFERYLSRWRRATIAEQTAPGRDIRSIVELDVYSLPALRLLYRGSELLQAEISLEDHPQSVRNELHNYHCYLRAVLQSLGDEIP